MKKIKNIFIYSLISLMVSFPIFSLNVYAEEYVPIDTRNPDEPAYSTEEDVEKAKKMEIQSNSWENWPKGPKTYGEAGIVMDADTGAILYAKNIDGLAYPASITKILATLVALENGKMEDTVTVAPESLEGLEGGYAHIGLKKGEEISFDDTLHAVLLASANEAAHALGSSVGEGYEWFIQRMNTRAKELGATSSNFVNTNGIHADDHYTTAKDMALITQELYNNYPEFQKICQTLQYTIDSTNKTKQSRTFQQSHMMFYEGSQYFDSRVVAGKTGYTYPAKNTLVTCTDNENMRLIVVVLKTHGKNVYKDTKKLIDYGYENFEKIDVSQYETSEEIVGFSGNTEVVVPKEVVFDELEMELVTTEGSESAQAIYTYNGQLVGKVGATIKVQQVEDTEAKESGEIVEKGLSIVKKIAMVFIIVAVLFALFLIVLLIYRQKKIMERKRRREERKRRYMREMERRERVMRTMNERDREAFRKEMERRDREVAMRNAKRRQEMREKRR